MMNQEAMMQAIRDLVDAMNDRAVSKLTKGAVVANAEPDSMPEDLEVQDDDESPDKETDPKQFGKDGQGGGLGLSLKTANDDDSEPDEDDDEPTGISPAFKALLAAKKKR